MTRLGDYLKELRGSLSTVDVEREIGIRRITLSRYERGENVPSPEKLRELAAFYECSYEKLRALYYEDLLGAPEDENIIKNWAMTKFFSTSELEIIELFRRLPSSKQTKAQEQLLTLLKEASN